ncbi:MAG: hypothetical protein EA343_06980 [Nodularia sp. (in: Bacteria)]|nr:MAG: hypothetical protein EA343_06980 [Nodularia sp. (in: cyanobacteria)]
MPKETYIKLYFTILVKKILCLQRIEHINFEAAIAPALTCHVATNIDNLDYKFFVFHKIALLRV